MILIFASIETTGPDSSPVSDTYFVGMFTSYKHVVFEKIKEFIYKLVPETREGEESEYHDERTYDIMILDTDKVAKNKHVFENLNNIYDFCPSKISIGGRYSAEYSLEEFKEFLEEIEIFN